MNNSNNNNNNDNDNNNKVVVQLKYRFVDIAIEGWENSSDSTTTSTHGISLSTMNNALNESYQWYGRISSFSLDPAPDQIPQTCL